MAKPAKSVAERKKELIDAQDYLSEKEKERAKKEVEKTEKAKAEKKEETRKILEEEQKEFEKAAEKSAALEEKELRELDVDELLGEKNERKKETSVPFYIKNEGKELDELDFREIYEYKYDPIRTVTEEPIFFRDEDREGENEYPGFGKHFIEILAEEKAAEQARKNKENDLLGYRPGENKESKYLLSPTVRASMQRSENMYNAYKSGEEWLMSDGGNAFENIVKGIVNRFRSAPGEAIEDFAYFLQDNITDDAPGKGMRWLDDNAEKVVEKNMAGTIGNKATEHFNLAREDTGVIGDKLIDVADAGSTMLSYGTFFGPSHLALSQSISGGIDEYRYQRENGADKSEALTRGGLEGIASYLIEKLGGLGADNSAAPKVKFSDVVSVTGTIFKTAAQEGGEGFAEYTVDSFINTFADAIYKGKLNVDWNIEEALDYASTDMLVGGLLSTSSVVNGHDIDIVDEMNKILTDSEDTNTRISETKDLKKYLSNRPNAKKELDNLLFYLNNPKTKGVEEILRNGFEKPVIRVNHSTIYGAPKSITQKNNDKGGVVRNYYNLYGDQYKQIADNEEHHRKENLGVGGSHAHSYVFDEKGKLQHRSPHKLNVKEILENGDLLWKYLK